MEKGGWQIDLGNQTRARTPENQRAFPCNEPLKRR